MSHTILRRRASDRASQKPQGRWVAANTQGAESLLQALGDGVIGVDAEGRVTYLNPVAAKLTDCEPEHALGQALEQVFHLNGEAVHQLTPRFIRRVLQDRQTWGPITNRILRTRAGRELAVDYSITPLDNQSVLILFQETGNGVEQRTHLLYRASYDPMTGLANRSTLQQTLNQLHAEIESGQHRYSLLLLDLDRFKLINDGYGHAAGDALLQQLARVMCDSIRGEDSLGRWGGEEFLCLLPETDARQARHIAERIRQRIENTLVEVGEQTLTATVSIGIASYPADGDNVDVLLRKADTALYEAKRRGRNRIFDSADVGGNIFSIAAHIEQALGEGRICSAYQPIVDLHSGEQMAEESLARILREDQPPMPASHFIQAAEQLHLAHRIDHRLIRETILRCTTDTLAGRPALSRFVNISADLLRHPERVQDILELSIEQCEACGKLIGEDKPLVIEITERELLENIEETKRILAPFLDFGLRLAIDDFGSGYSSLQYLADLPVSFLKVEGDLVRRAPDEPRVRAILHGVQDMADTLGLITVAENIENPRILEVAREIGLNWGQGILFGEPQLAH